MSPVMLHQLLTVQRVHCHTKSIFTLSVDAPAIAAAIRPGQFLNIKVEESISPLLRRPFSVYRREGDRVEVLFKVVGKGTALLSRKRPGDLLDVLGPLGAPFNLDEGNYSTAVLVAGGLGVAPMPLLTDFLRLKGKKVATFLGAKSSSELIDAHLENLSCATEDGSRSFTGHVVDLLKMTMAKKEIERPKIFGCGPTPMLRALAAFALERQIPAEVSLEGPMACGIGICQGCPVERSGAQKGYSLMCKDGPVFNVRDIVI
jgi:dihydroorotate dehydrogenase electron transfer subunit